MVEKLYIGTNALESGLLHDKRLIEVDLWSEIIKGQQVALGDSWYAVV